MVLLGLAGGSSSTSERQPVPTTGLIQLELPEFGQKRHAPGIVRIPEPQRIRRLIFHVPIRRYHQVFPSINTIAVSTVQTIHALQSEITSDLDLSRNEGRHYALRAADNAIELTVVERAGLPPIYARWVIAPPQDEGGWQAAEVLNREAPQAGGAEIEAAGLEIFEVLEDGRTVQLEKGLTAATRVMFRVRFSRREESLGLILRWTSETGESRTLSAGATNSSDSARATKTVGAVPDAAPEEIVATLELSRGENRIDAEVRHGTMPLLRTSYSILRRAPSVPGAILGEKWAAIIGVSDYAAADLDLRFAHRDAEAVRDVLVQRAGFSRERVRLLTNQEATVKALRSLLFTWLANTQPEDLIMIFLAGHGVQDAARPENYYFLAHDSRLEDLGGTALPMWDLADAMDYTIGGRRIIVLADTCHSGAVPIGGEGNLNFFNRYLEMQAKKKGRLVLTASQSHERSLESTKHLHGIFTHALLRGLGGAADDNPADGVVTVAELVDFLRVTVPAESRGEQHPSFNEREFDVDLPLAWVRDVSVSPQNDAGRGEPSRM